MTPEKARRREVGDELLRTGAGAMSPTIVEPTTLYDEDTGDPVLVVARYPGDFAAYRRAVLDLPLDTTLRMAGSRNRSRTFGFTTRRELMRRNVCRCSASALDAPAQHAVIAGASDLLHDLIVDELPERAAHDEVEAGVIAAEWKMGDRSWWTSGVLNHDSPMPYHRDANNLDAWSAMVVVRRGTRGGHLHIPEYDVVVECRDGDVLFFPGYELMHAVTPITRVVKGGYRMTAVYYTVAGMAHCEPMDDELARGRARRTLAEDEMRERQARQGLITVDTPEPEPSLVDDFAAFAAVELAVGDLAPAHKMLPALAARLGLDDEGALWLTVLWLAWYSVPSALAVFHEQPTPGVPAEWTFKLPIGNDRRAHRSPEQLVANLASWAEAHARYGGLGAFLRAGFDDDRVTNWRRLVDATLAIQGNGRWASYTLAETLHQGFGWPVEAPDLGHAHSSGPRRGLARFYGEVEGDDDVAIEQLDRQSDELRLELAGRGVDVDLDSLESLLCDFNAMAAGKYYPGKDVANMLLHADRAAERGADPAMVELLDEVARATFPPEYLVDRAPVKARVTTYRDTGSIDWTGDPPPQLARRRRLVYVVAQPGSGKSTIVDALLDDPVEVTKPFKHRVDRAGVRCLGPAPSFTAPFGGTDKLSMSVQPKVLAWLDVEGPALVVGEGDRLANLSFLDGARDLGYDVVLVHLDTPDDVADARRLARAEQLGTQPQNATWLAGRRTKVTNLVAKWTGPVVRLDGTEAPEALTAALDAVVFQRPSVRLGGTP